MVVVAADVAHERVDEQGLRDEDDEHGERREARERVVDRGGLELVERARDLAEHYERDEHDAGERDDRVQPARRDVRRVGGAGRGVGGVGGRGVVRGVGGVVRGVVRRGVLGRHVRGARGAAAACRFFCLAPCARARAAAQTQHEVDGGLLLDVVVAERAPVVELLAREDEALLVGRDALLVLDLGLDHVDGVGGLDLERDGLSRERLDEDLHRCALVGVVKYIKETGRCSMPCPGVSDFALDGRLGDAGLPRGQERQLEQYARAAYFLQDALNKAQQELQRYRQYAMMLEGQLSNTSHAPAAGTPGGVYGQAREEESAKQRKTSAATASRTLRDPQTLPKAKEAETTPAVVVRPEAGAAASEARAARATAEMRVEAGEDMAQVINNFEKMLDEAKRHLAQNELQEAKNAADSLLDKIFAIFYRHRLYPRTAEVNQISAEAKKIKEIVLRRIYEERDGKMAAVPEEDEAGAAPPEEDEAARRAATGAAMGGAAARAATGRAAAGGAAAGGAAAVQWEDIKKMREESTRTVLRDKSRDTIEGALECALTLKFTNEDANDDNYEGKISEKFRIWSRTNHPDKVPEDEKDVAESKFQKLRNYREYLKDMVSEWRSDTSMGKKDFIDWLVDYKKRSERSERSLEAPKLLEVARQTLEHVENEMKSNPAGDMENVLRNAQFVVDNCKEYRDLKGTASFNENARKIYMTAYRIIAQVITQQGAGAAQATETDFTLFRNAAKVKQKQAYDANDRQQYAAALKHANAYVDLCELCNYVETKNVMRNAITVMKRFITRIESKMRESTQSPDMEAGAAEETDMEAGAAGAVTRVAARAPAILNTRGAAAENRNRQVKIDLEKNTYRDLEQRLRML